MVLRFFYKPLYFIINTAHLSLCYHRGCGKGKWYKFNDTVVEEFELNDETLEYECFGGEYRPKVYDQCKYAFGTSFITFCYISNYLKSGLD